MRKIDLVICEITVDEAREIMEKVREIEQRNPERMIFTQVKGMENNSVEEAKEVIKAIFPVRKVSS